MAAPPVLHAARPVGDPVEVRQARKLAYVGILLEEAHVDTKHLRPEDVVFAMASPYERRGLSSKDIQSWIDTCDPQKRPPWDPIECFREKAREAMKPRLGLALPLGVIGAVAFLGAFLLSPGRGSR